MRRIHLAVLSILVLGVVGYATIPRALPLVLELVYPDVIFRFPGPDRVLYLTIDDGPSSVSKSISAVLDNEHVPATFFLVGQRIEKFGLADLSHPDLSFGNHFWSTSAFSTLQTGTLRSAHSATQALIPADRYSGYTRLPSDFGNSPQRRQIPDSCGRIVMGTVFPLDHWISDPRVLARLIEWLAIPGGIVILHDGERRGITTREVLRLVIPRLKAKGYSLKKLPSVNQSPLPTSCSKPTSSVAPIGPLPIVVPL